MALDHHVLYTPGLIAKFAEEEGFIETKQPEERRQAMQRIRISLGRFSNNHFFPECGDGMVFIKGQAPTPGWYGQRWQEALGDKMEYHLPSES